MKTEIALFKEFGLSTSNSNFKYSAEVNSFLGNAYTSMAGNTYFNEVRFMDGIIIKEDVGQGYAYTFLNGIRIFDLKSKTLLCEKRYHCTYYSESLLRNEIKRLLTDLLIESANKEGVHLNKSDVDSHIDRLIQRAFSEDQREILMQQTKLYLNQ